MLGSAWYKFGKDNLDDASEPFYECIESAWYKFGKDNLDDASEPFYECIEPIVQDDRQQKLSYFAAEENAKPASWLGPGSKELIVNLPVARFFRVTKSNQFYPKGFNSKPIVSSDEFCRNIAAIRQLLCDCFDFEEELLIGEEALEVQEGIEQAQEIFKEPGRNLCSPCNKKSHECAVNYGVSDEKSEDLHAPPHQERQAHCPLSNIRITRDSSIATIQSAEPTNSAVGLQKVCEDALLSELELQPDGVESRKLTSHESSSFPLNSGLLVVDEERKDYDWDKRYWKEERESESCFLSSLSDQQNSQPEGNTVDCRQNCRSQSHGLRQKKADKEKFFNIVGVVKQETSKADIPHEVEFAQPRKTQILRRYYQNHVLEGLKDLFSMLSDLKRRHAARRRLPGTSECAFDNSYSFSVDEEDTDLFFHQSESESLSDPIVEEEWRGGYHHHTHELRLKADENKGASERCKQKSSIVPVN